MCIDFIDFHSFGSMFIDSNGIVSNGLVSNGLVSNGLVSNSLVSIDFVSNLPCLKPARG